MLDIKKTEQRKKLFGAIATSSTKKDGREAPSLIPRAITREGSSLQVGKQDLSHIFLFIEDFC